MCARCARRGVVQGTTQNSPRLLENIHSLRIVALLRRTSARLFYYEVVVAKVVREVEEQNDFTIRLQEFMQRFPVSIWCDIDISYNRSEGRSKSSVEQHAARRPSITARKCKNGVECCCSLMDNASFLAKMKVFNHEGYDDEKI